jgi:hypothetical protein
MVRKETYVWLLGLGLGLGRIDGRLLWRFSMWHRWLFASSLSMPIWQLALLLGDQMVMHVQA